MGSTTPIHELRYPGGGDAATLATYFANLATDTDDSLPILQEAEPTKRNGLVWVKTSTRQASISDGAAWYPLGQPARFSVSSGSALVGTAWDGVSQLVEQAWSPTVTVGGSFGDWSVSWPQAFAHGIINVQVYAQSAASDLYHTGINIGACTLSSLAGKARTSSGWVPNLGAVRISILGLGW